MALIKYATKEITAKIVYYGPGLSGKTTNLQYINQKKPGGKCGELLSLATEGDRTLFFDLLPMNVGMIAGFRLRFQIFTVPGQIFYNRTRKMVLRDSDGVVFVADSQRAMADRNVESLENLRENLRENGLDYDTIPFILQFNKRDLADVFTVEELNRDLNDKNAMYFEAVATAGTGVLETLQHLMKLVLFDLDKKYNIYKPRVKESDEGRRPAPPTSARPQTVPPPPATAARASASSTRPVISGSGEGGTWDLTAQVKAAVEEPEEASVRAIEKAEPARPVQAEASSVEVAVVDEHPGSTGARVEPGRLEGGAEARGSVLEETRDEGGALPGREAPMDKLTGTGPEEISADHEAEEIAQTEGPAEAGASVSGGLQTAAAHPADEKPIEAAVGDEQAPLPSPPIPSTAVTALPVDETRVARLEETYREISAKIDEFMMEFRDAFVEGKISRDKDKRDLLQAIFNLQQTPDMMTAKEVAKYLNVSAGSIYQLAKEGKIPCTRLEGRRKWIFPKSLVDEWIILKAKEE